MKHSLTAVIATGALALSLLSTTAQASPPHRPDLTTGGNRWTITFYDDSSPAHNRWATQGICFYATSAVGTHQRYVWISDTYPDWNGVATQEGDQIDMHGDFQWPYLQQKDGGHDGMSWDIVTNDRANQGSGHWHEWVENGSFGNTIGFGNAQLQRVGSCRFATAREAFSAYSSDAAEKEMQQINLRSSTGELISPMGIGLEKLAQ